MVSQIKSFGNPQAMLENSPQYKEVMKYVNQNGGDPQKAFYKLAKEMGIYQEEFLMLLK